MKALSCCILLLLLCALSCTVIAEPMSDAIGIDTIPPPASTDTEPLPPGIDSGILPPGANPGANPEPLPPDAGSGILPPNVNPDANPEPLPPDAGSGRMIPPGMGDPPSGSYMIVEMIPFEPNSSRYPLATLQPGEPLSVLQEWQNQWHNMLPCVVEDEKGNRSDDFCPVTWDLSGKAPDTPGRFDIQGTLIPQAGYTLGIDSAVTCSAVVAGERPGEPEMLTMVFPTFNAIDLLALGRAPADGCKTEDINCFTTNAGEYFTCPIVWDYTPVNPNVIGTYPITGKLILPAGFAPPAGFKPFTRSIMVMDQTKVDLSAATFEPDPDPDSNRLTCHWIYKIPNETPVSLEYAVDKGDWKPDDQSFLSLSYSRKCLSVHLKKLTLETDYYFRIVYGAENAQTISNVLHVRLENWDFLGSDSAVPPFDIGGDRDGGDQGGSDLPPLVQPAPSPDNDNRTPLSEHDEPPDDPPVLETVTKTSTILSGARLNQLTAKGGTVLFEKQGVAMEFPAAFLDTLKLKRSQLLEVTIKRPAPDAFSLRLYANHKEIDTLPDTVVRLPWETAAEPLECVNSNGVPVSEGTHEPESRTVRFTIHATGDYRIQPIPIPPVLLSAAPTPVPAPAPAPAPATNAPTEQRIPDPPVQDPIPVPETPERADSALETVSIAPPPAESHRWVWFLLAGVPLSAAAAVFLLRRQRHE